jgi:hypothetical protein
MHALLKWVESDAVFNALGMLIAGIGIFAFVSLMLYTSGFLT